uniref:neuroblast differentiation-associated protein AHNAK-like isoform X1 n=1 Tax=Pristiophorus japonicus TaxID=55135 RepID=UPI00398ECF18
MAKKEDDLDVLLPNWSGAAAHGFSISGSDDGIFIKDVVQNSPVGKSGVMKEGDQIVSATIYFDEMGYEEAQKILRTVDRHTVGLKLHRKGEKLSPGGSYSWDPDRLGATSPDAVLSGDDEDYQRIFRTKIKPRLKSEDGIEASDQGDRSSSVHITRKVITRKVHTSGPTVMTDMDIQNPDFKIKVPRYEQVTVERSGPKLETSEMDVDVNLSGTEGLHFPMGDSQRTTHTMHIVKTKVVEVSGPDTEHGQTTFHMPQINLSGGTVQTSDFDVRHAKTNVDFSAPKVTTDLQIPVTDTRTKLDVDIGGSDRKTKMPSIKMPELSISGSKVRGPVVDIQTSIAKTDISVPNIEADLNTSGNHDLKGPKIDVQTSKIHVDGSGFNAQDGKLSIKTKTPNFNISGSNVKEIPNAQVTTKWTKVEGPNLNIGANFTEADVKLSGPKIEGGVQIPDVDLDGEGGAGKIKAPQFKMPGFSVSGTTIQKPDFDLEVKGPKVTGDVDVPDVNMESAKLKMPGISMSGPKIQKPDFHLHLKGTKETGDFDAPDINLEGDITGPIMNIKGPKVDIEGTDVKGSGLKFSTPSIDMPKIKAPDFDSSFKGPKLKGAQDINLPARNITGEIKRPKVDVHAPEVQLGDGSQQIEMPKFRLPKFQMGGGKVEGSDLDIDANLPKADVKLSGQKIEGGVEIPDVDLDLGGGSGKIKGSKFKMPGFTISGPKFNKPDFDLEFKGSKVSGDVDVTDVHLEGDIKGPNVNIKGPKLDIKGPDVKGSRSKFSVPSMQMPNIKAPDIDLNFKGTKVKGDHDINLPSADIGGEIKGPKLDVDVDMPEADIEGSSGRFQMPKFRLPKFQMGGGKVERPDLDIDANLPKADVKLSGPKIEGGVEVPDVDLDVEGGSGKIKGPKFKMPGFNISGPTFHKPDIDLHLRGPKVSGGVDVPDVNLEGDIEGPNMNIKGPKLDIEGPDVKGSGPKFSMPSINLPNIKAPELDLSLKGPKVKGNQDINLPSANIGGEIKGPKLDVDVDMPEADIEGSSGRFQMPKFRLPKFQMGGGKVEGPDLDIDANLPKADVKLSGPKIEGGVEVPDVDLDVEGRSGKIKDPKFKMPGFNISGPTFHKPDIDLHLRGPKLSGDVAVPDVNLEGDVKGPNVNIKGPKLDIEGPDVKGSVPKFSMPSIHFPKVKAPEIDLNLKGPKVKGDHDINLPSADIEGEIKGPKLDVDVDMPEADLEGGSGRFHMPKFRLPKFQMGGGKVEGPDLDIDANLPKADVKLSVPKIEGGVEVPDIDLDVEAGSGKIKGPKFKIPGFNISGPTFQKPDIDLHLRGPKVSADVDVPDVNLEGDIKGPNMNIKGPKLDIEGPDVKGSGPKISMPSINLPSFKAPELDMSLKGPKVKGDHDINLPSENIGGEIKGPKLDVDVDMPEADTEGSSGRFHMPKFRLPKFQMGGGKVEGPDLDIDANLPKADVKLSGPKIEGGVEVPDVDLDVEGGSGKIRGPKFKMPGFNISGPTFHKPDIDLHLRGPKMSGDVNVPDVNLEGDIKGPNMNIKGPKLDIKGPDVKGSGPKFSMPSINLPSIRAPEFDLNFKGPKGKGDHDINLPSADIRGEIKGQKLDVDVDMPEADIEGSSGRFQMPKFRLPKFQMGGGKVEGPDLDIDANLPKADVKLSGPKIEGCVEIPDVDLDVEGGSGKIKGPKFKMPGFNISGPTFHKPDIDLHLRGPKMSGNVDVPDVNLESDIKGSNVNIKGPKLDIEGPDVKGSGPKFSMPSINLPSFKAPELDLSLKGPKVKGDHDINLPSANIGGEIKGPKLDVDVDMPEADIEGGSGRFHMPKFRLPKFQMGGGKAEGPDLDIDANLPKADVELSGPKIEGGVEVPDVDLDVEGGSGKIRGPKFKMPGFNISGPTFHKPDIDLHLRGPKVSGGVDVPDVNLEGDIKGPNVNIKGPKLDIEGPDVKGSGPKFSMPSIHFPKIKAPEIDLSLKGPKVKGDHEINLPSTDIGGEIKGPKLDVDVDMPEADIEGSSGRFHMPKFRLPKFQMGGGKVEGPDLDIDANLPEADVKLSGPKIEGGVEVPDIDLDVDGSSGKIKGPKFKMPGFNISGPTFHKPDIDLHLRGPKMSGDVNVPDVNLEGDIKGPNMNIKGPKLDIKGPDVKGSGPKFSMPSINLPSIRAPEFDLNFKGPKGKGDHDINLPSADIGGEIKGQKLDVDVDMPEADIEGSSGRFQMPKFRLPKFQMGGGKAEGPDLDIDANLPKADVKLSGPKIEGGVEIPDVDLDVEGGSGKIKGPKFKMPGFNISGPTFHKPDIDLHLRGPKMSGNVDVPDVNLESDIKGSNVNIKGPKLDIEGPDVKGSGPKFSMPSINLPSFKAPELDLSLKGPKVKGDHDINLPSANIGGEIKGPKLDVDVDMPEADIEGGSGRFHMPKFRLPKFQMGGGKAEGPDLDIDANLPKADVELSGPKIEGGVEVPDVDLDVEGGSGKIRGPKFKMPGFNISGPTFHKPDIDLHLRGPKVSGGVDVPDVNLEGDIKGPNVNIKGPKLDIEGPDVKGSGPKFSMPSIHFPKIKAPEIDLSLKGPKVKGDHEINLPSADIGGEIKGPKLDVDVDMPEADIEGSSGRFHMPKFRLPKFQMGGGKVEGPDLDIDANLPEADVKLSGPKIEGGVEVPDVDLDVDGSSGKIKGPKFKMPGFNISGPTFHKPDIDLHLRGPKMSGDVNVPDVNLEGDIKGPNMNIKGPKLDIKGPDVKGSGPKFSMPSINLPSIRAPEFDLNFKGPKGKGDHDINLPSADIGGEIKGQKLDVDVDMPEADIEGSSGRFQMPKFRLPKFQMGGGKAEGPDLDIDANLPKADVKLSGPKIEGGVEIPDVDLDVEGGSGKIKGPKFKMPGFNISGPTFHKPDIDLHLRGPKMSGNVDVPDVNLESDIKGPNVNIKGPKLDIEGPDVKGSGPKFSMPSINLPSFKAPELDLSLKGPKVKGDHDINLPSANIGGEIKGPKLDVDVDMPEADIEGSSGRFHMPKFRLPKFQMGGGKAEGPDLDIDANLPKADVELSGPKIEGGVEVPDVDLDVEGGSGKIRGPKFKMPGFNISGPTFHKPDIDLHLRGPKVSGGVDVPDVNLEGDIKGPNVNIKGPKLDIEGPDVKGSGPKFSMPSIHFPKIKAPEIDLSLKGPKVKGDHDINLPSADIGGEIKGPKLDVDVDMPEADIEGSSGRFHMPKFRLPKFQMGGGKVEGPDLDIDANIPKADVKLPGPKIEGGVEVPDVDLDVEGGSGKIRGPKFKMPGFKISGPTFHKPDFNLELKGLKVSADVDVPDVNLEGDIKGPNVNIKGPKLDIEGPDVKGSGPKFSMPSIQLPSIQAPEFDLGLKGPKLKGDHDIDVPSASLEGEIKGPKVDVDVDIPEADIEGGSGWFHMPKFKLPKFQMGGGKVEGPDLDIDANLPKADVNLSGPKIEGGVEIPDVDLDVDGGSGKIKGPKFKMPGFKISGPTFRKPDFDLEFKGPKVSGDVDVPDVNLEGDIKGPNVNMKGPKLDIEGPDIKGSGPKFSMPSIQLPSIKAPDFDLGLKGPKLKGDHDIEVPSASLEGEIKGPKLDIKTPEADIKSPSGKFHMPKFKMPRFRMGGPKVEGPDLNIDANLPEADVKLSGPKIEGGVEIPDVDLDVEGGSGKIKGPKFKMPGFNISGPTFHKPDIDLHLKSPKVSGDVDVPDVNLESDIKGPNMNIKGPKLDNKGPDVKGSGPKFSMPSINLPNIKAPEFDLNLKSPKVKGDHDINLPSADIGGEIKGPKLDVDVDMPEADIEGGSGRFHMPKFKLPKFQMGGGKVEGPDVDIDANLPKADVKLSGPKIEGGVEIPDVDLDVEGGSGKIKGPKFKMPGFNISGPTFHKPDIDLHLRGPKVSGDVNVPDVNLDGDIKGPNMNMKGPKLDIEGPDVKGSGPKFSMPSINLPSIKAPEFELNIKGPKVKGDHDINFPSADIGGEIKGPKLDVDVDMPEADIEGGSGRFHMPKFRLPKFQMGGGKVEGPDLDIDANLPKADVKLSGPKIEGGVEIPDVDLDVEGGSGKIKGPKFKMPGFNISGPTFHKPDIDLHLNSPKVSGDVAVPDVNLEGDIKGPNMNIKGPKLDIEGPDVKGSGPKFSMPSINMPSIKAPEFDLSLKGPKVKGDHDINLPSADIGGEIKGPKLDVDVDMPEADIEGGSGRFHMPKFRLPKFQMGGGKIEGPDLDIDANLPKADVKLSGPKIEGGVEVPDVDLDVEGGSGKIRGPKFKMPGFNISGPTFHKPDIDLHVRSPKVSGDVDIPDVNLEGDIKGPNVNIKGPKLDIEGPDMKGSGPKFSMPSINLPSIKAPELDLSLKGPKVKGGHDINLPSANIGGEIKGPKIDVDVDMPEADIEGGSGRFQMPKFRLPKFQMGGGKVEGPDLDIDANLPKADVKLSGPKIEGGVEVPDVDLDVEGGSGKIKGPKFKLPGFKISGPKFHKPDFDLELKGPKVSGDIIDPDVNLEGDIKGPNLTIKGPKLDRELTFGDHDIDLPSASIGGEIKGPKIDVDMPEGEIKSPSGKFHMPKFKMPSFRMGGPKVEGPDLNIDANLPEADVKLSGPKIEGDVEIPDVDLGLDGGSSKIKGPKFKMPGFGISAPTFHKPDFDLELKGPKVSGDVDVPDVNLEGGIKGPKFKMPDFNISAPKIQKPDFNLHFKGPKLTGDVDAPDVNLEGDIKGPNVNIKGPKLDIEGPDVKGSGSKFSMPSLHLPNIKAPELDLSFKGPKLKGDQDIDISSPNIEGEIKGPKVDVETPDVDLEGAHGQFRMPKIKLPKFQMGGAKVEGPDLNIDAKLPEADVNISGPKIKSGVEVPEVDMDADGKIKGPGFQMPGFNISLPKVKAPNFDLGFKGPKLTGDVDAPDINMEGDIKGPNFDIKGPKVDIKGPDMNFEGPDVKGNGHKFSLPSLGISAPNISSPDMNVDFKGPKLEGTVDIKSPNFGMGVSAPELDTDSQGVHLKMPRVKAPKFGFGMKGPQGDINAPSLDMTGPDVDLNVDSPDLNVSTKGKKGKFKMPKFNIKSKKPAGDVKVIVPKSDLDLSNPEVDIKSPDLNVSLGSSDGQLNIKPSKVKKPRFGKMKLSFPDIEFDLASPKIKGELPSPKIEGNLQAPDIDFSVGDIKGPHVDIKAPGIDVNKDVDLKGSGFKAKGTKLKFPSVNIKSPKISEPDLDINLKGTNLKGEVSGDVKGPTLNIKRPEIDFDVDAPNVDIEKPEGKLKMKMKRPKFNISGPKFKGSGVDIDVGTPKLESGIKGPDVNINAPSIDLQPKISAPDLHIDGHDAKVKGSSFEMPSWKVSGPKISSPDFDLKGDIKGPKIDMKGPKLDLKTPDVNVEGPEGKLKMPEMNISGTKLQGSDLNLGINAPKIGSDFKTPGLDVNVETPGMDINADGKFKGTQIAMPSVGITAPNLDIDLKKPQLKGDVNISSPNIKGDFRGLDVNVKCPSVDVDAPDFDIKGSEGKLRMPQINFPKAHIDTTGLKIKGDNSSGFGVTVSDFGINAKGPKLEGNLDADLSGPKIDTDIKCPKVDIRGPNVKMDRPDINFGGLKGKGPSVDFNASKANIGFSGPKFEGDLKGDINVSAPDVNLSGKVKSSEVKIPTADVKFDVKGGVGVPGSKGDLKGAEFDQVPDTGADIKTAIAGVSLDQMRIPKFKHSQFQAKGPNREGPEMAMGVSVPETQLNVSGAQGPSVNIKGPQASVNLPEGEMESSGIRIKKGKIKMPKFNFSKSKGKSSIEGSESEFSASGAKIDIKGSKGSLGFSDIDMEGPEISASGKGSSLDTSTSPKGKSGTLDFSLFKSKKSERHRSSSLSDEHELSPSSSKGRIEFGEGAAGAKGKKSKLKFGTFGGFGAKSKGSYEVTLNEGEAAVEGSGISLVSKKSRMSSSSSNESGSRAGFRLPKVELNINKNKA